MTWNPTTLNILDAAGVSHPVIAYTDGTNFAFAHPLLDNTGAIIAPATAANQATMITALGTLALDASVNGVLVAQGSTTAGQKGPLIQAAVATSAPTLTNGQSNPLSLDTAGNLRVNVVAGGASGGTSSTFAAAFPNTGTALGAKNGTNMVNLTADNANNLNVNLQTALPAGTNTIGSISSAANTSGGASTYAALGGTGNALLTNTPVAVKASPGNLYGVDFVNTGIAAAYVQCFDVASGAVTLGTTVPKMSKWVPAGGSWEEKFTDEGKISFATAITVAATTTPTGSTAPATGILANILFK